MKLSDTGLTAKLLKEKAKQYMIETYERFDMVADHAKGVYLYDEQDTPYLDFYAGIAVNSVGNCNEKVVKAVQEQAGTLMQVFNYPYSVPQALLAEKICTTIGMDKIFYQNSGTEANEAMIKMARKYGVETYGPHKYHIVTAANSFHGRTFGSMSATGQPDNACQVGFGDMTPGFSYAPYNDLEAFKAACNENTIAIMIEPVQGEGGVNPATPEFMTGLRQFCDENGLLLLLDEVQTGWCRTGNWMSFMNYGIKPDIVSMAKALGGGVPLSAVIARKEIMDAWPAGAHGGTFGGNPLACAAGLKTLEIIERDHLSEHARRMGEYFLGRLKNLQRKYRQIGDVRGLGLMDAIELVSLDGKPDAELCQRVRKKALERNLLLLSCGSDHNVIRFIAPLIVTEKELDLCVSVLDEILGEEVRHG